MATTFGRYVEEMNALAGKFPELLDSNIVCSRDDEGNSFGEVFFHPCAGKTLWKNDFTPLGHIEDGARQVEPNTVCIN